jgi:hypothetical protein
MSVLQNLNKKMNLFFVGFTVAEIAESHCEQHLNKMIVELFQMLSTAHRICQTPDLPDSLLYKTTHQNHPMSIWIRACVSNYLFALSLGRAMLHEWSLRYNGSIHASSRLVEWMMHHTPHGMFLDSDSVDANILKAGTVLNNGCIQVGRTVFGTRQIPQGCSFIPLTVLDQCRSPDVVDSFRKHLCHKSFEPRFTRLRQKPIWWKPVDIVYKRKRVLPGPLLKRNKLFSQCLHLAHEITR